jgi:hypothetical protein
VKNRKEVLKTGFLVDFEDMMNMSSNCIGKLENIILKKVQLQLGLRKLGVGLNQILYCCSGKVLKEAIPKNYTIIIVKVLIA